MSRSTWVIRFGLSILGFFFAFVPLTGLTINLLRIWQPRWLTIVTIRYGNDWISPTGLLLTVEETATVATIVALLGSVLLAVSYLRHQRSVTRLYKFTAAVFLLFLVVTPVLGQLREFLGSFGISPSELTTEGALVTTTILILDGVLVYCLAYALVYRPKWRSQNIE